MYLAPMLGVLGPLGAVLGGLLGGLGGAGLGSLFGGEEKVGAYTAITGSDQWSMGILEDSESGAYASGGFGMTFGLSDRGSNKIDATQYQAAFNGLASLTNAIEDFFGPDLAAKVKAGLGDVNEIFLSTDLPTALRTIVNTIAREAGATGETVGVVFERLTGNLSGTAEEIATQVQEAMQTTSAAIAIAEGLTGTALGDALGLTDDLTQASLTLVDYALNAKEAGETTAAALGRIIADVSALDQALYLSADATTATGQGFVNLALQLEQAAEDAGVSISQLTAMQAAYYDNFYSEEEKAQKQRDDAIDALRGWNDTLGLSGEAIIDTKQEFRSYIESLDLTTEAGMSAYVEAMKLMGAIVSLDDAMNKLGDGIDDLTDKYADQRQSLEDLANSLDPESPLRGYDVGSMASTLAAAGYTGDIWDTAAIGEFVRTLTLMDDAGGDAGKAVLDLADKLGLLSDTAQERADLEMRLLELVGTDEEILAEQRRRELAAIDDVNRAILENIYAVEDQIAAINEEADARTQAIEEKYQAELDAINASAQAQIDAINATAEAQQEALQEQQEALRAAYEAEMEAIQAAQEAAQETLSLWEGMLSSIQSAIDQFETELLDGIAYAAAAAQLAYWAQTGTLPSTQEELDAVLKAVGSNDASNYTSAADFAAAQQANYANLLVLESNTEDQVDVAQATLDAIEAQTEAMQEAYDEQIRALQDQSAAISEAQQAQIDAVKEWQEAEIDALNAWQEAELAPSTPGKQSRWRRLNRLSKTRIPSLWTASHSIPPMATPS
jgi:hypothetical protein